MTLPVLQGCGSPKCRCHPKRPESRWESLTDVARERLRKRFWNLVSPEPNSGCWIWLGYADGNEYGAVSVGWRDRVVLMATHVALAVSGHPLPAGLFACHRCDHPWCVNPDHLFAGTHKDNMADMDAKGRRVNSDSRGERNGRAKLTAAQAQEIVRRRFAGERRQDLAAEFGVDGHTVFQITTGRKWAHVTGIPARSPFASLRRARSRMLGQTEIA